MTKDRYFAPPPIPPIRKATVHAPPPVAQMKPMPGAVTTRGAVPPPPVHTVASLEPGRGHGKSAFGTAKPAHQPQPVILRSVAPHAIQAKAPWNSNLQKHNQNNENRASPATKGRASITTPKPPHTKNIVSNVAQADFDDYIYFVRHGLNAGISIRKTLQSCYEAIRYTKNKLSLGAGNIIFDIKKSGGVATKMTSFSRQVLDVFTSKLSDDFNANLTEFDFRVAEAVSARRAKAGNCSEFASVLYFRLIEMGIGKTVYRCSGIGFDHAFVIVGDNNGDVKDNNNIVVDAWPANPYPVLLQHWQYANCQFKVDISGVSDGFSGQKSPLKEMREIMEMPVIGIDRKIYDNARNRYTIRQQAGKIDTTTMHGYGNVLATEHDNDFRKFRIDRENLIREHARRQAEERMRQEALEMRRARERQAQQQPQRRPLSVPPRPVPSRQATGTLAARPRWRF